MTTKEQIQHKRQFFVDGRLEKMQQVLDQRTRHVTFVLEDIRQPQNASAVLRSSDAFGFQDVHIIENIHSFSMYPLVTKKADQWLTLQYYNKEDHNTRRCLQGLKDNGYKLVATGFDNPSYPLHEMPVTEEKIAVLIGTEASGLSDVAMSMADEVMYIPMYGFSQSFNLSVTAAMTMQYLRPALEKLTCDWKLSEAEKDEVLLEWMRLKVPD